MPVTKSLDDLNGVLISLNGVLTAAQPVLGIAMMAITLLWKKWKEAHPDGTQEDFFALLSGEASAGKTSRADWLTARGYVLTDGTWTKPPAG